MNHLDVSVFCSNKNMFYVVGYCTLEIVFSKFLLQIFMLLILLLILISVLCYPKMQQVSKDAISPLRDCHSTEWEKMGKMSKLYKDKFHRCTKRFRLERTSGELLVQPPAPSRTNFKVRLGSPVSNIAKLSMSPRMEIPQPLWLSFRVSPFSWQRIISPFFSTGISLAAACNCCLL